MKNISKIFAVILVFLSGLVGLSACGGDPYNGASVSISDASKSITLSEEEENNYFVVTASVSGVKKDANIIFSSNDGKKVEWISTQKQGDNTYIGKFLAKAGGKTTITATCEQNASARANCEVEIIVPVKSILFYGNEQGGAGVLPVERGVKTNISGQFDSNSASLLTFEPADTTQRDVQLSAFSDADCTKALDNEDVKIEGNYLTVLKTDLVEFYLKAKSVNASGDNDINLTNSIKVDVLEPINVDNIVATSINTDDPTITNTKTLSSYVEGGVKHFVMDLANNIIGNATSGYENYKTLEFLLNSTSSFISDHYTIERVEDGVKNFIITNDANSKYKFHFERGEGNNYGLVTFNIYHKGYETLFPCKTIKVKVQVSTFAEKIVINRSATDATSTIKDFDVYKQYSGMYDVYSQYSGKYDGKIVDYKGAKLNIKAVSQGDVLYGQDIKVYILNNSNNEVVTNGAISIKNNAGVELSPVMDGNNLVYNRFATSGEDIYITYNYDMLTATGAIHGINDTYVLVAQSAHYEKALSYDAIENFTSYNVLNLIGDSTVSAPQRVKINFGSQVALDKTSFSSVADISKLILVSSNPSLVNVTYDKENSSWVLKHSSEVLGSCRVNVVSPNGYITSFMADIYQPTTVDNVKFRFAGTEYELSETDKVTPYPINVVCGASLVAEIVIDGKSYNYSTLPNILNVSATETADLLSIGLGGFNIQVDRTKAGETILNYQIVNIYEDEPVTLYCSFNITITKPITAFYLNLQQNNNKQIIANNQTKVMDLEAEKLGELHFMPDPNDASLNKDNLSFYINYNGKNYFAEEYDNATGLFSNAENENFYDEFSFYYYELVTGTNSLTVYLAVYVNDVTKDVCVQFKTNMKVRAEDVEFTLFLNYQQSVYDNAGKEFIRNITNSGERIVVKNVISTNSILVNQADLSFNKNQLLVDADGSITGVEGSSKHERTISYTIVSNGKLTYPGVVLIDSTNNEMDQDEENPNIYYPHGTSATTALFAVHLDELNRRIKVVLKYDKELVNLAKGFEFKICALDSINDDGEFIVSQTIKATLRQGKYDDPYIVTSQEDLQHIKYDLGGCYYLNGNIDMMGEWEPIGTSANPFTGSLNGNGYVINDLKINATLDANSGVTDNSKTKHVYLGLFGYVGKNTTGAVNAENDYHKSYANSIFGLTLNNYSIVVDAPNNDFKGYVYIGAFAGVSLGDVNGVAANGTIKYDGVYVDGVNSWDSLSGANRNILLGSIVGVLRGTLSDYKVNDSVLNFNNNLGNNIFAGGVVGYNDGGIIKNPNSENYVNVIINSSSIFTLTANENTHSAVGGVAGINYGTIENVGVKCTIYSLNNLGGVAGYNYGTIENASVTPTLWGKENIGGIAGNNFNSAIGTISRSVAYAILTFNDGYFNLMATNFNTGGTFNGLITGSKVLFINKQETVNHLNSGIIGVNNIGGLVGVNYGLNDCNNSNKNSTISYSSVKQYYNTKEHTWVAEDDLNKNESKYFGDIVVLSAGNYAGGLIGYSTNTSVLSCFVDANVSLASEGTIYGGLVGYATGTLFVYASPVMGKVLGVTSTANAKVGGFIGDATNVSCLSDTSYFPNAGNSMRSIANIVSSDYGIFNSYTLLKFKGLDESNPEANYSYISNFAYLGERVEDKTLNLSINMLASIKYRHIENTYEHKTPIVDENGDPVLDAEGNPTYDITYTHDYSYTYSYKYYEDNDIKTVGDIVKVNGVALNSDGSDSGAISSISRKATVSYNKLYAFSSFYMGFSTKVNGSVVTFGENNALTSGFNYSYNNAKDYSLKFAPISEINPEVAETTLEDKNGTTYTVSYNGGDVLLSREYSNLTSTDISGLVYDGSGETGITETIPADEIYYKNSTIYAGYPVPFAEEKTYVKNSISYPNLVFDVAPVSVSPEYLENYSAVNTKDSTKKLLTLWYDNTTSSNNTHCLTNNSVIKLNIEPQFVADGKVTFTSSNTSLLEVYTVGSSVYAKTLGTGICTITISSELNTEINETITVVAYEKINNVKLYNDKGTNISGLQLIKGIANTVSIKTNGKMDYANLGFKITASDIKEGELFVNGKDIVDGVEIYSSIISLLSADIWDESKNITITPFTYYHIWNADVEEYDEYKQYFNSKAQTLEITSVNGTSDLNGPDDMQIIVTNNEEFDITLTTDASSPEFNISVECVNDESSASYNYAGEVGSGVITDGTSSGLASKLKLVYLKNAYSETNKLFTTTFRASISPTDYQLIDKKTTFVITISLPDGKNPLDVEAYSFKIVFMPEQVLSAVAVHYSNLMLGDGSDADDYSSFKYPSTSIIPGYTSLVTLDINPSYAELDYVKVIPSNSSINLEQLVENLSTSYGYSTFLQYFDYDKDYSDGSITLKHKISKKDTTSDSGYVFDGRYYVAIHAPSSLKAQSVYITFEGYVVEEDGSMRKVFTSATEDLNVIETPQVDVTFDDGLKYAPAAVGTRIKLNITASAYDALYYNLESLAQYGKVEYIDGSYYFVFGTTRSQLSTAHNNLFKTFTIEYTASRTLPFGVFETTSSVRVLIVPYLVNGLEFNDTVNGVMDAYYNQVKALYVNINASYSQAYNNWLASYKNDSEYPTITSQLDQLEKQINYTYYTQDAFNDVFTDLNESYGRDDEGQYNYRLVNGVNYSNMLFTSRVGQNFANNLQARPYADFVIRMLSKGDDKITTSIQFTSTSMASSIYANVKFGYIENAEKLEGIIYSFGNISANVVNMFEASLTANIMSISDEEYPNPITSVDEFKDMQLGESYILLNDLVLEHWTPMEGLFKSLDGNGYTITIMSFAEIPSFSQSSSNVNIGLFSNLGTKDITDVTLKNLTVEINPGYISENGLFYFNNSLEISAKNSANVAVYKNIKFGVIAGENYGTITNANVINNAKALRDEREAIISQYNSLGFEKIEGAEDFTSYFNAFEANSKKDQIDVIYINSGKNNTSQGNIIGGLVGVNNGYITNSSVENVSIKGSDYVAGFVGENSGTISSSYFKGASVIDTDSNSTTNRGVAGFVANNTKSGIIQYSYAMGIEGYDKDMPETGLGTNLERNEYLGYEYREADTLKHLRAMNSAVYSQTIGAGFVYSNLGNINNSYSNILVSTQIASGFAYKNHSDNDNGVISDCYSLSSVKAVGQNDIAFATGGTVNNCFYLKVNSQDIGASGLTGNVDDYVDQFSNESENLGTALSAMQFTDYNSFVNFAFNSDYSSNIENVSSVWFMPQQEEEADAVTNYLQYFRTSLGYKQNNGKGDIVAEGTTKNVYISPYTYGRPELVSANLKTLSIRYYNKVETEGNIWGDPSDKGYYYSLISTYTADKTTGLPSKEASADNAVEYDIDLGSITNPILISDGDNFNYNILNTVSASEDAKQVNKQALRIIKDINFDGLYQRAETYKIEFKGNLDGNGMNINGLCIIADDNVNTGSNVVSSVGLFSKITPTTVSQTKEGTTTEVRVANTGIVRALNINIQEINASNINLVGILAGHIDDGKVYNISVNGDQDVNVAGLNAVGGVAGLVTGASELVNITSNVSVAAKYSGNKNLFRKTNYFPASFATFEAYNGVDIGVSETIELSDGTEKTIENNIKNVSYVGGVVGIYNVDENPVIKDYIKNLDRMRTITTQGAITLQGHIVGGVAGYVGVKSHLSNAYMVVSPQAKIIASYIAGGVVAHNEGYVDRIAIYHSDQENIDKALASAGNKYDNPKDNIVVTGNSQTLFGNYSTNNIENSNAYFIGGVIGFNNFGRVDNVYSRVDVISQDSLYAGGIVGLNIGGEINTAYTTGSVFGAIGIGGIIGIQAKYGKLEVNNAKVTTIPIKTTSNDSNNMLISNAADLAGYLKPDKSEITVLTDIAGINIWQNNHINPVRAQYHIDAMEANIGMLTGFAMPKSEGTTIPSEYYNIEGFGNRLSNESMYFMQTYRFVTTQAGIVRSNQTLKEIGNLSDYSLQITDSGESSKITDIIIKNYSSETTSEKVSGLSLYNVKAIDFDASNGVQMDRYISGEFYLDSTQKYTHFSRMGRLGSLRTLQEFIGRAQSTTYENRYFGSNQTVSFGNSKLGTDYIYSQMKIYQNWDILSWDGTRINDNLVDKISPEYVFPDHANNVEPTLVMVYTEDDLTLMNSYRNAEFVLQNDINLSNPWKMVGNNAEPFKGKLRSAYASEDEIGAIKVGDKYYKNYTISNLIINGHNQESMGFVSVAESAQFTGFSVAVNKTEFTNAKYAGVLLGSAQNTSVAGVTLLKQADGATGSVIGNSVGYLSGIVANGEAVELSQITINNLTATLNNGYYKVNENKYIGAQFGWVAAGAGIGVTNDSGVAVASEPAEPSATLTDFSLTNSTFTLNLNTATPATFNYALNSVKVGGLFGAVQTADASKKVELSKLNANFTKDCTPIYINISGTSESGVETSSTTTMQIGGLVGYVNNMYLNNLTATINENVDSFVDYNNNSSLKVQTINTEGVKDDQEAHIGGVIGRTDGVTITDIAIVGNNKNEVLIKNTQSTTNIYEALFVGGIIGYFDGNLNGAKIDRINITVENTDTHITTRVGGAFGTDSGCTEQNVFVVDCNINITSNGAGETRVGGIMGSMYGSTLKNSASSGSINVNKVENVYAGGLAGYSQNVNIENNSSNTDIVVYKNSDSGTTSVGGILGAASQKATITNSYATGYLLNENAILYYTTERHTIGGVVGSTFKNYEVNEISLNGVTSVAVIGYTLTDSNYGYNNNAKDFDDFYKNTTIKGGLIGKLNLSESDVPTISYIDGCYYNGEFVPYSSPYGTPVNTLNADNSDFNKVVYDENGNIYGLYGYKVLTDTTGTYADIIAEFEGKDRRINPEFYNTPVVSTITAGSGTELEDGSGTGGASVPITIDKPIYFNPTQYVDQNLFPLGLKITNKGVVYGLNLADILTSINVENNGLIVNCDFDNYTIKNYGTIAFSKLHTNATLTNHGLIFGSVIEAKGADSAEINIYGNVAESYYIRNMSMSFTPKEANNVIIAFVDGDQVAYYCYQNDVNKYKKYLDLERAQNVSEFANSGFDFQNVWIKLDTEDKITNTDYLQRGQVALRWMFKENIYDTEIASDYRWSEHADKTGVAVSDNIITVGSAEGLAYVANFVNGATVQDDSPLKDIKNDDGTIDRTLYGYTIKLMADINLSGKIWMPIGIDIPHMFQGSFDGNGKTISNMHAEGEYAGLFGVVSVNSKTGKYDFANFIMEYPVAMGNTSASAVVGYSVGGNSTKFSKVGVWYADLNTPSNQQMGAFVGKFSNPNITIDNCYAVVYNIDNIFKGLTGSGCTASFNSVYYVPVAWDATAYTYANSDDSSLVGTYKYIYRYNSTGGTTADVGTGNSLTAVNLAVLQRERLKGFDWATIWTRVDGLNDNLPMLNFNAEYWTDFASNNKERDFHIVGGNTIEIYSPAGLAYIANYVNSPTNSFFNENFTEHYTNPLGYGGYQIPQNMSGWTIKLVPKNNGGGDVDYLDFAGKLWTPIGLSEDVTFQGSFDGNGKTIKNLKCYATAKTSDTYAGLFGYVKGSGTFKNVTLQNVDMEAPYAGGLIAYARGTSSSKSINITSITTDSGRISAATAAGGIVGSTYNKGGYININHSKNGATICDYANMQSGSSLHMGGIVGYANNSSLFNVFNYGVINSTFTGNTAGYAVFVGGVAGYITNNSVVDTALNDANVTSSYISGSARTDSATGGIVGYSTASTIQNVKVGKLLKNVGDLDRPSPILKGVKVSGNFNIGGIVGYLTGNSELYEASALNIDVSGNDNYGTGIGYMNQSGCKAENMYLVSHLLLKSYDEDESNCRLAYMYNIERAIGNLELEYNNTVYWEKFDKNISGLKRIYINSHKVINQFVLGVTSTNLGLVCGSGIGDSDLNWYKIGKTGVYTHGELSSWSNLSLWQYDRSTIEVKYYHNSTYYTVRDEVYDEYYMREFGVFDQNKSLSDNNLCVNYMPASMSGISTCAGRRFDPTGEYTVNISSVEDIELLNQWLALRDATWNLTINFENYVVTNENKDVVIGLDNYRLDNATITGNLTIKANNTMVGKRVGDPVTYNWFRYISNTTYGGFNLTYEGYESRIAFEDGFLRSNYFNTIFSNITFIDINFSEDTMYNNVKFVNCWFNNCTFEDGLTDTSVFENCDFTYCTIYYSVYKVLRPESFGGTAGTNASVSYTQCILLGESTNYGVITQGDHTGIKAFQYIHFYHDGGTQASYNFGKGTDEGDEVVINSTADWASTSAWDAINFNDEDTWYGVSESVILFDNCQFSYMKFDYQSCIKPTTTINMKFTNSRFYRCNITDGINDNDNKGGFEALAAFATSKYGNIRVDS